MSEFENIDSALEQIGRQIVEAMQNELFENKSVVSGDLARSITHRVKELNDAEVLAISMLWYGELLEDGGPARRAGRMPPIRPIEGWIKRKKIPVPPAFKTPKSFAFAIAKSIGKNGAKAYRSRPFIMESINNAKENFGDKAIQDGVEADLIENINVVFEKTGGKIA